jgi:hypothetical protein
LRIFFFRYIGGINRPTVSSGSHPSFFAAFLLYCTGYDTYGGSNHSAFDGAFAAADHCSDTCPDNKSGDTACDGICINGSDGRKNHHSACQKRY